MPQFETWEAVREAATEARWTAHFNPLLIFDNPAAARQPGYISSQEFGRAPWPRAHEPAGYVTNYEIMAYEELYYSNQRIDSSNRPRQHLDRRIYGVRATGAFR